MSRVTMVSHIIIKSDSSNEWHCNEMNFIAGATSVDDAHYVWVIERSKDFHLALKLERGSFTRFVVCTKYRNCLARQRAVFQEFFDILLA